ncbi:formylglycine-generating enzyme family protein [Treponema denticola]|uniref:formylglycine-generating enzyme family protein n=1 Tax=Treponema denticola TaxID=158 RepID=UPI0020A59A25|nr:SUMF1/EgtB/PvdO family nonheme iron enzyme [Treponema denticola]UTC95522.1 formylglycine-generating enzyme family protein [Treponema denticola]
MKHITKLILLAVLLVASCKNPVGNSSAPSSPQQGGGSGGGSTPAQITITVAGDEHVILKPEHTFEIDKGKTWHQLKAQAEDKIDHYEATYGLDKWTLTNAAGQPLTDDYTFTENATVFIITKQTSTPPPDMITITVAGDTGVILKEAPTFEVTKGKTWNEIESLAESKIKKYKQHHELKNWHLINDLGPVLDDSYITTFNADTTVFIETKPVDVKLTIKGDHINITSPAEIYVSRGTKWSEIKDEVMGKVSPKSGFVILAWKKGSKTGIELYDDFQFRGKTDIYVETRPTNVTITIKGDDHVQIGASPTITKPYGVKWSEIKKEAKTKITCNSGYVFAAWKKGSTSGKELFDIDEFEEDTDVYATTQQVPISSGVKVMPPTGGIIGHTVSYTLPAADASWKGVFISGRTVNLNTYTIGKHEVTVKIWNEVCEWAQKNGYLFEFDPKGDDTPTEPNQPMANISWTDCIAWCNAYTEMMFGNTEECVYRAGSVSGAVIKHAFHGDKAYCDFSKKGYRLPTEAEWEYAARYQGTDNTNAESYGTVYLTNVNSASGATKPIGFEGMSGSPNFADLRDETARVAVFNQWWNGMAFATQTPPVNDRANVGSKPANKLGLCDMSGNVAEWCWDLYTATVNASTNAYPTGPFPDYDTKRVVRGGNWSESTGQAVYDCMTGKRKWNYSGQADPIRGFRLVWNE